MNGLAGLMRDIDRVRAVDRGHGVRPGIEAVFIALLLLGAAVNLAAGARRPLVERAILSGDHYAHADRAAEAVARNVPAGAPLHVVVYDADMLGELDAGVWFDYRVKWLLYPRRIVVARVDPNDPRALRPAPGAPPPPNPRAVYPAGSYVLFFRASAPPTLPPTPLEPLAEAPMWVLARLLPTSAHAPTRGSLTRPDPASVSGPDSTSRAPHLAEGVVDP
jgi:hypothetical protein